MRLAAWGSRSGWEARGGLGPFSRRGPEAGVGVGGGPGQGRAVPPPWGCLVPPHLACFRGTHPSLAPRHFAVRREMPSTFPLSLQPLDCQMRLCASLGVFSTAPFLSGRAGLTSPTALSGLAGWGDGSRQVQSIFARFGGRYFFVEAG